MHGELLGLALVLAAALAGGRLAERVGYPAILGELIAGILLGPPLLGLLQPSEPVSLLGDVGVLLMMLFIGMHLNLGDLQRASKPGLLAAAGGFLVPAGLGMLLLLVAGRTFIEALFVGLAMGVTSLATKSRILVDLRILDTRVAHVLVAGALITDLVVLVVFAAVIGPTGSTVDPSLGTAAVAGIKAALFGVAVWFVGTKVFPLIGKRTSGMSDRAGALVAVIVTGLFFSWVAELAGLHAILGAFVAGLFIGDQVIGKKVGRDVQRSLRTVSVGLLAPFFFVSAGFEVSFGVFVTDLPLLLGVIVLAVVGKVVGTAVFYLPSGHGWREGVVVGAGMNGRGAVEIIVAEIALARGVIDRDVFSILVFMAIFTTATVPVLLTRGVAWLRRRGELVRAGDRRGIIIVGAGPIARVLGRALRPAAQVVLIDTNPANQLAGEREGLQVVSGSALDEVVLQRAGVDRAALVIALTPNTEVNLLAAQMAVSHGVPEVSVLLGAGHLDGMRELIDDMGGSILHGPEVDLADWDHAVVRGEVLEVSVVAEEASSPAAISALPRAEGTQGPVLPLAVVSGEERRPYTTDIELQPGDKVIMLARAERSAPTSGLESRSVITS